jgi:hypothetical protein
MFVALVLTVCSVNDPQDCDSRNYLFESHGSLTACMFEAPPWIAVWQEEHPGLRVTRWKCEFPREESQPL